MPYKQSAFQKLVNRSYWAILATVYPSGMPQALPVWFEYDGRNFLVVTTADAIKVNNIKRTPQVALYITNTPRFKESLTIPGRAELVFDNSMAHMIGHKLTNRYLDHQKSEEYNRNFADTEFVLVRIIPKQYIWTN